MNTLKEWAEHYYNVCKVWVYPGNHDFSWEDWRNMSECDYRETFMSYDWDSAVSIKAVTGKKGICAIQFPKDEDPRICNNAIQKALKSLDLPKDYQWVMETEVSLSIVIDVYYNINEISRKRYRDFRIITEKGLNFPPYTKEDKYYSPWFKDAIPDKHPTQVAKDTLYKAIETLNSSTIIERNNNKWFKGRNREEFLKVGFGCGILLLLLIVCAILGIGSEQKLDTGQVIIGFVCIVVLFLVGAFVTGAFKNK